MSLYFILQKVKEALAPLPTQAALTAYLTETDGAPYWDVKPANYETGRAILNLPPTEQVVVVHLLTASLRTVYKHNFGSGQHLDALRTQLFARALPYTAQDIELLLTAGKDELGYYSGCYPSIVRQVERFKQTHALTPNMTALLQAVYDKERHNARADARTRKLVTALADLLEVSVTHLPDAGEVWADAALADLDGMEPAQRTAWEALLSHAATASAGKPSAKWQKEADKLTAAIGDADFARHAASWIEKVAPPPFTETGPTFQDWEEQRDNPAVRDNYNQANDHYHTLLEDYLSGISEKNIDLLKGLAWCCAGRGEPELARALARMTQAAFQSVPHKGTWASRAGNAAIYALGQMTCAPEAVGQLSRLRAKLRDRSALKAVTMAIENAASRSGMAADALEDLAVPTGGLDREGTRRAAFGNDGAALLSLHAQTGQVSLQWFGADGTERKAEPAAVKKNHADDVKAVKAAVEEVKQTLSAQATRLDRALLEERTWQREEWEARFLSHPILGNLARRLVWAQEGEAFFPAAPGEKNGPVTLWHPITSPPAEVLRLRDKLADAGIVQPFKQAHREVYLLTDAERSTRTYSNRFAAHIIKQHQFNSLCVGRGWSNKLRLMVDDSYPPATRDLPQHNLRAEFWVEGIGDNHGTDTNETGTYLRLSTDQVRFYRRGMPVNTAHAGGGGYAAGYGQAAAEPLPLEEVPPLVLSETLRDVDLFVGVASVGNDPTWADGGPEGRFRNYWHDYAFGDLGETAKTRAAVLERLLPRLKIAARATLTDKFLRVRGDLRTYKIHLGSGNILMEPNDQYLCIVPSARDAAPDNLFLPFEEDRTLAIILSKAFLLADDTQITDATITRQIR